MARCSTKVVPTREDAPAYVLIELTVAIRKCLKHGGQWIETERGKNQKVDAGWAMNFF